MDTLISELKKVPDSLINAISDVLNNKKHYNIIEQRVKISGVLFERNGFQVSINNISELNELAFFLITRNNNKI